VALHRVSRVSVVTNALTEALGSAIDEAQRVGWGSLSGSIRNIGQRADVLGLAVMSRPAGPAIEFLRPTLTANAGRRSLSARHGLGAFPLHSDCAHWRRPPDFVLIQCASGTSTTPTLILPLVKLPAGLESAFRQGMFLVGYGRRAFYAPAMSDGGLRFDEGCMRPLDGQALRVTEYLRATSRDAVEFHWTNEDTVLVMDNRRALHGRAPVHDAGDRRLARLYLGVAA